jgi:hypothetical protein
MKATPRHPSPWTKGVRVAFILKKIYPQPKSNDKAWKNVAK